MSFSQDLLAQARQLATYSPGKPRQANLRRAVSAAYYALFHFIGEESARLFVGAAHQDKARRDLARRAIAHTRLKDVCREFQKAAPKPIFQPLWSGAGIAGDPDIGIICTALIDLQEARHEADYDFSATVSKLEALDACDQAERAMVAWENLRRAKPDAIGLFAMAVMLWPGLVGR